MTQTRRSRRTWRSSKRPESPTPSPTSWAPSSYTTSRDLTVRKRIDFGSRAEARQAEGCLPAVPSEAADFQPPAVTGRVQEKLLHAREVLSPRVLHSPGWSGSPAHAACCSSCRFYVKRLMGWGCPGPGGAAWSASVASCFGLVNASAFSPGSKSKTWVGTSAEGAFCSRRYLANWPSPPAPASPRTRSAASNRRPDTGLSDIRRTSARADRPPEHPPPHHRRSQEMTGTTAAASRPDAPLPR
jgi:hypothetical protein